jgi:spore photoproduct lyase
MENRFFITEDIKEHKKGRDILRILKNYSIVKSEAEFLELLKKKNSGFEKEKGYFLFTVKKGRFLKSYYLDENFRRIKEEYYLSYENNCPFNCVYCYLRDYYSHGACIFYVNIEDMFSELDKHKGNNEMISCGIVNDSLVFDNITNISHDLINYFKNREDLTLEFRTKSKNIKGLLNEAVYKNILVSFTFSPEEVIEKYEFLTSSLNDRITAAKKLQEHGYDIGIRIDPVINTANRKKAYTDLIIRLMENLDTDKIRDIGLGSLRYTKGLKDKVLSERKTDLFYNELITGIDGKERYFKGIRIQMYDEIIKEIRKYGDFDIYLGMEEEYIWKKVLK